MEKCFEGVSFSLFPDGFSRRMCCFDFGLKRNEVKGDANSFLNFYHIEEKQWETSSRGGPLYQGGS
jgi:hypothetical protein